MRPSTHLAGVLVLLGALAAPHVAASPAPSPAAPDAVVAELRRQADAWDAAIVHKDRAAIEANMADDFRNIDGSGNVAAKAEFVDGLVSPRLEIDPYSIEEFDVRRYG